MCCINLLRKAPYHRHSELAVLKVTRLKFDPKMRVHISAAGQFFSNWMLFILTKIGIKHLFFTPQESSIGIHCVAFLQLLYNEWKSPQGNPLDSYRHFTAKYRFRRTTRSLIVSLNVHFDDRMQSERRKLF